MKYKLQSKISFIFFIFIGIGILISSGVSMLLINTMIPVTESNGAIHDQLMIYIGLSVLIGFILASMIGYKYIKSQLQPISELAVLTKRIARGEYVRSKELIDTGDEIGELNVNFNLLNAKLENAVAEIQEKNSNMDVVLKSMPNGIIALDKKREISMVNSCAEKIFGIRQHEVIGKTIDESVFTRTISKQIDKLSIENPRIRFEAEVNFPVFRICSFTVSVMTATNDPTKFLGIVIIIQDITEIRKLENIRKEFVANVSHELKTPLTSIKGFVETLRDGAIENDEVRDRFLDIINIETDRLFYLIQDILTLSEIENKDKYESVDIVEPGPLIEKSIDTLYEQSLKKNIEVIYEVSNDCGHIKGDQKWFIQMLINLIDNAIKYTPENGKVFVTMEGKEKSVIIRVEDTGYGIPEEDLPRIFERFYRVDKARSKKDVDGTGLGLAIVKHVALSFGGNVSVKSELGKGTVFTVDIPKVNT